MIVVALFVVAAILVALFVVIVLLLFAVVALLMPLFLCSCLPERGIKFVPYLHPTPTLSLSLSCCRDMPSGMLTYINVVVVVAQPPPQ